MKGAPIPARTAGSIWHKPYNLLLLLLVFVISRLPLLNLGFGLDADAWRIAGSAFDIRNHLVYHASRFPGYPLPEFINALVINDGWLATNSLTMLLSLASVILFARILELLDFQNKMFIVVTYAFLPILWINSTNTMDYMWSLCFIMLTWYFLLQDKALIAGLMMGMAVGSRLQTLILVLPFLYLCYTHRGGLRNIVRFLLPMLTTIMILYAPLFLTYGLAFVRHYPSHTGLLQIGYMAVQQFGLPAIILLAITVILSVGEIYRAIKTRRRKNAFVIFSVIIAIISFAATPYHVEYVISFIPFMLILVYQTGKRPLLILISILLLSHAFVAIGRFKHLANNQVEVKIIDHGALITNFMARTQQLHFARTLSKAEIGDHSIVILGPQLPIIAYLDQNVSSVRSTKQMYDCNLPREGVRNFQRDIWYRYLLASNELAQLLERGYKIYYIDGVREYTMEVYGYDLADYSTTHLAI
jgi:hypothetical protein